MAEDLQRYLKTLVQSEEGLEAVIVSDRDGVQLVEAKNEGVSVGVLKPPFLGTFSIASEQASKLGLGKNRAIISNQPFCVRTRLRKTHAPIIRKVGGAGRVGNIEVAKMMPIKGLSAEETHFHRRPLVGRGGNYLSSALLCMWDNIHGPKILSIWSRDEKSPSPLVAGKHTGAPSPLPKPPTLLGVAIHSLNNEPGRTERILGIESKFFVMEKNSIIAGAFIFTVEINQGRPEVFSFILVLPHSEMQEYLTRFSFYEAKVHQLLRKSLIEPLCKLPPTGMHYKSQARLKEHVMKEVANVDQPIQNLAQLMHSLRYHCIPPKYTVHQTYLGNDLEAMRKFLEHSITCLLQCSGHAIVVGEDRQSVNTMLRTLGLFLSDQEKKLSRLACPPPSSMDGDDNMDFFNYEPNLFLQGFVVSGESSYLPFSMANIRESYLPPCIIHISTNFKEVRWVEMNIPFFIRVKDDNNEKKHRKCLDFRDLHQFKDFKECSSRMMTDFIER
ncbi:Guanine nucleotide exchange C9orf72 homolog, partial [Geodia barretti]